MTAATITLTDFLLARIAEDEAVTLWGDAIGRATSNGIGVAGEVLDRRGDALVIDPARVLAECVTKRAIVELHGPDDTGWCASGCYYSDARECRTLLALSGVYADHADFDPRWAL